MNKPDEPNGPAEDPTNPIESLLKSTGAELAILVAIGGGFWGLIAPPVGGGDLTSTGFCIAVALAVSLFFRMLLSNLAVAKSTVVVSIFALICLLIAVFLFPNYMAQRSELVFSYQITDEQTVEVVKGYELLPKHLNNSELVGMTNEQLLSAAGGPDARDQVWTPESINGAETDLVGKFTALLLSVLVGTMAIVEIIRKRIAAN